ncbi:hypothetical protein KXD40_003790 [Peronospora effusa]|nr:hypothetical protein KXD40_003790 [Peronospora effusa]
MSGASDIPQSQRSFTCAGKGKLENDVVSDCGPGVILRATSTGPLALSESEGNLSQAKEKPVFLSETTETFSDEDVG